MAAALVVLSLSELWRVYGHPSDLQWAARLAFLALAPCLMGRFGPREWALSALAMALSAGLLMRTGGIDDVLYALDRAAFFGAFIYLVTLLKEAAERSKSVLALGQYMTRQPAGRRYYALSVGGHLMGILLNFGAISLLAPLIQRGSKAAQAAGEATQAQAKMLEQQQLCALMRGFSWMVIWSPTALTQAILISSFDNTNAAIIIPLGIAASIAMILVGRVVDKITWRNFARPDTQIAPVFPTQAAYRFLWVCAVLIALTIAVAIGFHVTAAMSLMLVAPIVMLLWFFAQNITQGAASALRATGTALYEVLFVSALAPARSAYTLGMAGFIGECAAKLAPVAQVADSLNLQAMPSWVFLSLLPVIITLGGQIALSPLLVVVFLAAVMNELPVLPADPNLIVFALGAGWALGMFASPNASATLLVSGITGIAPTTLTWRWNGVYALCCFAVFVASFYCLSLVF